MINIHPIKCDLIQNEGLRKVLKIYLGFQIYKLCHMSSRSKIYFLTSNVKYVTSPLGTSEATSNNATPSNVMPPTLSFFKETPDHDNVCAYLSTYHFLLQLHGGSSMKYIRT
jgi:hypothetical protein